MLSRVALLVVSAFVCIAHSEEACQWFPWTNDCPDPHKFPQQIRVAFAGPTNTIGMAVSWTTTEFCQSVVQFGTESGVYTQTQTGDLPSSYFLSWQHNVVLSNLEPLTKYYYRVGDPSDTMGGMSEELSFTTKPQDGANPRASFGIGIMGDMGTEFAQGTLDGLLALQQKELIDFSIQLGDFAYADDRAASAYEDQQNNWGKFVEPLASMAPFMGCPGNHEAGMWDLWSGSPAYNLVGNFSAYNSRFRFPYEESGSASNMWYSFDYANVHFISIDTETDFPNAAYSETGYEKEKWGPFNTGVPDQVQWLRNNLELARKHRAERPWIIVYGHRPVYTTSKRYNNSTAVQDFLEDLFWEFEVDLYLCGHVHAYNRIKPTYKGELNANATTYIVAGNGGNIEGQNTIFVDPEPVISASRSLEFGYGMLQILDNENLQWTMFNNQTEIIDKLHLTRPRYD